MVAVVVVTPVVVYVVFGGIVVRASNFFQQALVEHGADIETQVTLMKHTPLHAATQNGHLQAGRQILLLL